MISSVETRLSETRVNLHPVARRQQQRFGATSLAHDRFSRSVTSELLPRCNIRSVMTQSDAEKVHGNGCSSAVNVMPHRSAKAALKPIMHNAATRFGASHLRWRACKMAAYSSQSTIAATT